MISWGKVAMTMFVITLLFWAAVYFLSGCSEKKVTVHDNAYDVRGHEVLESDMPGSQNK